VYESHESERTERAWRPTDRAATRERVSAHRGRVPVTERDLPSRRDLLRTTTVTAAVASLAGCGAFLADDDSGEETTETTFGYGGTTTADGDGTDTDTGSATTATRMTETMTSAVTATTTNTQTETDTTTQTQGQTPTDTTTQTQTQTPTTTDTTTQTQTQTQEDEYGEQLYGEYGYGGVVS